MSILIDFVTHSTVAEVQHNTLAYSVLYFSCHERLLLNFIQMVEALLFYGGKGLLVKWNALTKGERKLLILGRQPIN